MSDREDQIKGPMQSPSEGTATVHVISEYVTWYKLCSSRNEGTVVVVIYVNMKYL